jgi:DNA end-binding protein Ku
MAASTWRGRIAFGMVSIPVRLYKAARRERIRFHNVYRPERVEVEREEREEEEAPEPPRKGPRLVAPADPTPVEPVENEPTDLAPVARVRSMPMMAPQGSEEPAPVAKEQMLKAFELEKDRYVVFDPGEIAALRPQTSSELAIEEFARLSEIDPVFFETSYYVEPDQGGEKPYALLYTALAESGYCAIGTFAMHGREHAAVVRPGRRGLILHTLFYAKEVRAEAEFAADRALVNDKERQLAINLVEALAAPFDASKLKNAQEERVRALIESRAPEAVPGRGSDAPRAATPPVDIMEALRKSLAAAKKPAARETRTAPAQTVRRPRRK